MLASRFAPTHFINRRVAAMGTKRKEPDQAGAGDGEGATPIKEKKKRQKVAPAAAEGGEQPVPSAEKPKKPTRPRKPKADAAAAAGASGAGPGAAAGAAAAGGAGGDLPDEQENPEDLLSHERMRELLRQKRLEDADKIKCASGRIAVHNAARTRLSGCNVCVFCTR